MKTTTYIVNLLDTGHHNKGHVDVLATMKMEGYTDSSVVAAVYNTIYGRRDLVWRQPGTLHIIKVTKETILYQDVNGNGT